MIHVLDLGFLGFEQAIASFLIETSEGPVLVETGPHSTFPKLETSLKEKGFKVSDLAGVFLTHIHLDHAGAAWACAHNGAKVYVHPFGATHLADPSKLMESARRIYKDDMDRLWGEMKPIARDQLVSVEHGTKIRVGDQELVGWHTPGHARHHIAWQLGDVVFTGDVAGVKIGKGPVVPPCPPPDIDLEAWLRSIDLLLDMQVFKMYLTHFGEVAHISGHLEALKGMLNDWAGWVKEQWEKGTSVEDMTPQFSNYTARQLAGLGVSEYGIKQYEAANPSWMSVSGLIRYWKKQAES